MHNVKLLTLSFLLILSGSVASVHAQPTDEALSTVHEALTGRWNGIIEGVNPVSGEDYTQTDTFTFVTTGSDGLDGAWWTDFGLILYEYLGAGEYHARSYGPNGTGFEEDLEVSVPSPVTADREGMWTMTGWAETPDGIEIEIRETFSVSGDELTMITEQRPLDDEQAAYRVIAEATYARVLLQ
jgi:hypothetical protein